MKDNRIRIPMIVAIVLQSIAALIGFLCYFMQGLLRPNVSISVKVFPINLVYILLILIFQVIIVLTMQTYEGESRRGVGIILTIVYCLCSVLMPYISIVANVFASREGVEYVAAQSTLGSSVSLFTSPFSTVATALTLIAIGRYGISKE
ncbi:MAG: hypothetical protein K6E18_08150 [Lachnospiraceae bacterium]|nr:hypothetical protein [Lachnospiraceae bacterium]